MQANIIHPVRFNLADTFDEVTHALRLSAKAKNLHIQHEFADPVYVYANKDMINLVVRNLISNAIKFTPDNGNISVHTRVYPEKVVVSITDNGIGISEKNLERLFNDFYTSNGTLNESGTGLGLILCKEFVNKNGGSIDVQSVKDKGSTFSFTLPVAGS